MAATTPRRVPVGAGVLLAVGLGVAGPAARLVADGTPRRAALVVLLGGVAAVLSLVTGRLRGGVVLLAVGGAVLVVASPTGMHRASAVAVAGVVVACAALVAWSPWPGWPPRRVPRVGVAVAPLAAAQVVWFRQGPVGVVVVLLAAALALVEAHHRWPAAAERRSAAVQEAVERIGRAVARTVVLVVALPFVYLPGTVGAAWERRRARGGSTWVPRTVSTDEEVAAARRPFAAVPRTLRRRRQRTGLAVLAVAVIAATGALSWRADRSEPPSPPLAAPSATEAGGRPEGEDPVTFSDLPAYAGVDFADALQAEQRAVSGSLREDPVTVTAIPDHDGEYTHVTDGVRRTRAPECACPRVTMWWVGGSVAFGLGQRDDHTVASELVRLAAEDGIALEVTNIAVPGWTVWQEDAAIRRRLEDHEPPDIVVSLSGYNDAVSTLASGAVHGGDLPEPTLLRQDDLDAFLAEDLSAVDGGGAQSLADAGVARYGATRDDLARTLADRGSSLRSFFQPDALATPAQLAPVRHVNPGIPERVATDLGTVLDLTAAGVAAGTTDLRHIYDGVEDSVFVDWSHTNEVGARLAAEAVHAELRPALRDLAG